MTFTESNTVEALVRDILCGGVTHRTAVGPGLARRYGALSGVGWHYLGARHLPRQTHEILVEDHVREALVRLNPEIAAQPDRADDVLYRLRAILMGVRTDGLVKANEEFAAWLAGEWSMPFGTDGEHVTVRLVDLEDVERNQYVVSAQYTVRSGANERRADLVLLVNGVPLVVIEAKTPVRSSESWFDGATQIHDDYERHVPELFVPNLCSAATEGKDLRYGSNRPAGRSLGPVAGGRRRRRAEARTGQADRLVDAPPEHGSGPARQLHGLRRGQGQATSQDRRTLPAGRGGEPHCRAGRRRPPQEGLGLALPGFRQVAPDAVRRAQAAAASGVGEPDGDHRGRPDRPRHADIHAADAPNLEKADSRADLERLLAQDARKIIITTIFKFGEVDGVLNDRHNIIVLVDEAHRSQEGGPRAQDAPGAPERVPVRIDRDPDQPRRPEHVLRLRRRGGTTTAT